MGNKISLICFDQNFNPNRDYTRWNNAFRLSFDRMETKTDLAARLVRIRLPEDRNRSRVLKIDSITHNRHIRVTDWKNFLKMATPEQIQCVQDYIATMDQSSFINSNGEWGQPCDPLNFLKYYETT